MTLTASRAAVWLNKADIFLLTEIVLVAREVVTTNEERLIADGILSEFGVARSRVSGSGFKDASLSVALGFGIDGTPVRLSEDEMDFLKNLPLPDSMNEKLSQER